MVLKWWSDGEHRYCSVCGPLQPQVVAADALGAEITRLDALAAVPATERAPAS
jgi:hypothetical protein